MLYAIYFGVALVFSLLLTPAVRRFALARKIVDQPNERKIHHQPVARLGGVAVWLAFWLTIIIVLAISHNQLNFIGERILGVDRNLWGVILGALVLLVLGVFDDIIGLSPIVKLLGQILASVLVVAFGIKILWIHNPLTGLDVGLGWWTYILVPAWLVLIINVTNWLDGVDGLATGIGFISALILFFLAIAAYVNQPATALLAIALAGALLGFLPYNFNPAQIFLGDSGSMFIGFMIGIFAIISGGKFATAALVLGFPILDALWVIGRRLVSGQAPWRADRLHLHHRLLDAGLSQRQVVLCLYTLALIFGIIALSSQTREKLYLGLWLVALMVIIAGILVYTNGKRR